MTEVLEEVNNEQTEAERLINLGISVELKKLGTVKVKELTLENTIELARELSIVFSSIDIDLTSFSGEKRGFEWIMTILADPTSQKALRVIAAASTEKNPDDFKNMGLHDWLKIMRAFKQVIDWEELKELFFQIVPPDMMKNWIQTKKLTEDTLQEF